ncbi:WW domain-containing adapter protein with coiled-coil, partial [Silurus meridionalis]
MVMHARKQPRLTDGCNERRDFQSYQTLKYQSKSHTANEHRHDKLQNSSDQTPPSKMLRRSDSPDAKRGDGEHGRTPHAQRPKESSTSSSPHENSVNHGHHSANSHSLPPKCAEMRDPSDDWSEHISSSGKKYYYNCRTEVSQWEKPKEWLEREQRQKDAPKTVVVNSFPKDRDYRQETMQAAAASSVTAMSKYLTIKLTIMIVFLKQQSVALACHVCVSIFRACSLRESIISLQFLPGVLQYLWPPDGLERSQFVHVVLVTLVSSPAGPGAPQAAASGAPGHAAHQQLQRGHGQDQRGFWSVFVEILILSLCNGFVCNLALCVCLSLSLSLSLSLTISLFLCCFFFPLLQVLTAAVTQASLQSMLHKLLTAGPSAFNITALLSQAAQLSTQAQQPSQSPVSVTPDASSPKSCLVSPRVSTPQTNSMASKPLSNPNSLSTQIKVSDSAVKSVLQHSSDKTSDLEDPRLQRQNSQAHQSSGPNGCLVNNSLPACPPTTFSPSLALHFNENLIRHVQSWPSDHVEKQAARLREEVHTMGSMNMSEICVELKKLRSLVRVCEIQATLREQRILFLRQEIKELEKLKNQNSFMV